MTSKSKFTGTLRMPGHSLDGASVQTTKQNARGFTVKMLVAVGPAYGVGDLVAVEPWEFVPDGTKPTEDKNVLCQQSSFQKVRKALQELLDHYIGLVASGDCGVWNPREEDVVKQAQAVLVLPEPSGFEKLVKEAQAPVPGLIGLGKDEGVANAIEVSQAIQGALESLCEGGTSTQRLMAGALLGGVNTTLARLLN